MKIKNFEIGNNRGLSLSFLLLILEKSVLEVAWVKEELLK